MQAKVTDDQVVLAIERNIAIIRFDMDHKVAYVNELFAKTLGYKVEEMIGKDHKDFCLPEFANNMGYGKFWRNLATGNSYQDKIERMDARGNRRSIKAFYQNNLTPFNKCLLYHKYPLNCFIYIIF